MAWIESHQQTERHPKTLFAVRELHMDKYKFLGHLHALWWWALDYADAFGNLPDNITAEDLAAGAGLPKTAGKRWASALLRAGGDGRPGFIEQRDGHYVLHDWYDYSGKLNAKREANRDRMRAARAEHVQRTCAARAGATQHNSTQHNSTQHNNSTTTPTPSPGTESLSSSFPENDLLKTYHDEIGEPTPAIREELEAALKIFTPARLTAAIKEAGRANKRSWRYVSGILDNWREEADAKEEKEKDEFLPGCSYESGLMVMLGRRECNKSLRKMIEAEFARRGITDFTDEALRRGWNLEDSPPEPTGRGP